MMLPAAVSLGLLLAAGEVRWAAGVQSEARGRSEPGGDSRTGVGELDLHAQLGLSSQGADGAAALTYTPSLLLRQVISGAPSGAGNATRQAGRLELQTRLTPSTRLSSRTVIDWGLTDFSPLSGQVAPVTVGLLPPQRFVRTLGVEMMLDLAHAFSRRLQLLVTAGMQRGGGLGHEAVSVLPMQVGLQGTASLTWAADRASTLTLRASAAENRFSIDRSSVLSDVSAGWTVRAAPHTLADAAAGLVFVRTAGEDVSSTGIYGSGTLGVGWDLPLTPQRALRSSVRLRLTPGVDRFTALAIQMVRAEGAVELAGSRLQVGISSSEGHAVGGVGAGADDFRLEGRTSWIALRGWSLEGALSAARTNQPPFAGWQAQALVGLRWADRGSF